MVRSCWRGGGRRVKGGVTHEFRMKTLSYIVLSYHGYVCERLCEFPVVCVGSAVTVQLHIFV